MHGGEYFLREGWAGGDTAGGGGMFAGDHAECVAGDWVRRGGSGRGTRAAAGRFVRGGRDFYFFDEQKFIGSGRGERAEDCGGAGGGYFEVGEGVWGVCAAVSGGAVGGFGEEVRASVCLSWVRRAVREPPLP